MKKWFWDHFRSSQIFRRLRPRIMTMILALVLPVCLLCIINSSVSAIQGVRLSHMIGNNGLSAFAERTILRCRYENIDLAADFPAAVARQFSGLLPTVSSGGGKVFVSRDGIAAFEIVSQDGETKPAPVYAELVSSRSRYEWQDEESGLRVLVTFPYNFALRSLPAWFWIAQIIAMITVLLCPVLYKRLKLDILDPMAVLDTALDSVKTDRAYRIPPQPERHSDEFLNLYAEFNAMAQEVQASYEKDMKMLETEMDNLRLQVNPHMLLNSYNMIYALAESKNYAVIQDYTLCLVDYFRYVLRRGQKLVAVEQELQFVDNFIRIQRIRFPGRFSYVYQAEKDCLNAQIPPLLIENFVENAIKYALEPGKPIEIVVSVYKEETDEGKEKLHIAITDTGSGIRPEVLEKLKNREPYIDEAGQKHIGIYNCFRRIELFYGEEGDIHFTSGQGRGTQIYLIVPYMQPGDDTEKEGRG